MHRQRLCWFASSPSPRLATVGLMLASLQRATLDSSRKYDPWCDGTVRPILCRVWACPVLGAASKEKSNSRGLLPSTCNQRWALSQRFHARCPARSGRAKQWPHEATSMSREGCKNRSIGRDGAEPGAGADADAEADADG